MKTTFQTYLEPGHGPGSRAVAELPQGVRGGGPHSGVSEEHQEQRGQCSDFRLTAQRGNPGHGYNSILWDSFRWNSND